tara:strand:+ start:857 stop:1006 length:150 start_codon:yes stop_codon:yes gene_type:complete
LKKKNLVASTLVAQRVVAPTVVKLVSVVVAVAKTGAVMILITVVKRIKS